MSRTHSRSPPLPSPSATSSPTSTTTNMNVNYAPAPTSFPSTTDAWMGSRPTVSPLKTADDAYSRSSSSSFYASTNLAPSPPPSLHQSTPRAQWLASHDSGRRASYGQYPPTQQYSSPGPLGSPQEDHWSPNGHHAHSPGSYLPQTQSYQQYHPSQPQQPPAAYPAAVPLNQSVHIGSVPMPVPLGSSQPRRRGKLPKATTEYLKDWLHKHSDHPYPTEDEKKRLCAVTGLSMSQVSNWMINARRRILAPARANATPATTTTPYGAAPQQPFQGPPRPASGDSSATSRSGDMLYSQPQYAQTLPPLPQPGSLGGSPPHRSSWPSSQQQSHSPPHPSQYYNQGPPPLGPPTDGTASRGSPHSSHSDHILPPVSSLPALPVAATNGSSTDSQ